MSIPVICQCGRRFRAKDSEAGKQRKCPACGAYLQTPQLEPESCGSGSVYGNIKPKYCLTVVRGPKKLQERFRLRRSRVTSVGKASDNAVILPAPKVSRHHCQISFCEQGWLLEDLKSTNGTYVNGSKIASRTILKGGERLRLGEFELILECPKGASVAAGRLDEQLEVLRSADPGSSQAAMEFLASCGSQAAEHLVPKLSGFDTVSGQLVLAVLAKLGSEAVPALVEALTDRDKLTRGSAARALGKLGAEAAPAVDDLLKALDDQDPTVYAEVAWALTQIGASAVPGLVQALSSGERSRQINAAWTLGRMGPDAVEAVPSLSELVGHDDQEISQVAAAALKKINGAKIRAS